MEAGWALREAVHTGALLPAAAHSSFRDPWGLGTGKALLPQTLRTKVQKCRRLIKRAR